MIIIGRNNTLTTENNSPATKYANTPPLLDTKSPVDDSMRIDIHIASVLLSQRRIRKPNCAFILTL